MLTKSKMAYLMHVDWDWIKQRPHFLYEELTRYCSVDLFYIDKLYDRRVVKVQNSRKVHSDSNVSSFKKLPLSGRISGLRQVERLLNRKVLRTLSRYDYIWITSPLILDFISIEQLENKIVIYDCMDDFLGFYPESRELDRLWGLEIALVQRANWVFTSSSYLKSKMIASYGDFLNIEPIVVNNAISPTLFERKYDGALPESQICTKSSELFNFMYIGTIGEWMDFEMIQRVLDHFPDCMFTMIGPIDTEIRTHPRIHYTGAVPHDELVNYAQSADALVMPFVLNELVRAVDPVKIYEYIYFHKPIIAIDYEEMYKFQPFVHLYSNEDQLIDLVQSVKDGKVRMYEESDGIEFLKTNTWQERCIDIVQVLKGGQS